MTDVLIVKNIIREGPGILEKVLNEARLSFDIADLDKGGAFPDLSGYRALVVLGGPDSANDTNDKMTGELAQVRAALDKSTPYLGICLGLQVLVKAAGGNVVKSPVKEVGFTAPNGGQFTVELTDIGRKDAFFENLPDSLKVFHLHGETVELTDDMQLLATGRHCKNQIVKVAQNAYGVQSHFELTPEMLALWAKEDPDLVLLGEDKLKQAFTTIQDEYTKTGRTLLRNFLSIAKLV